MKKSAQKLVVMAMVGLLFVAGTGLAYKKYQAQKLVKEPALEAIEIDDLKFLSQQSSIQSGSLEKAEPEKLLNGLNLKMAFYPQAPYANWDEPWQEACEEAAALLIANNYFKHNWTVAQFNEEILKLVEYENKVFGDYKNTDVDQSAQFIEDYLGLKTKKYVNPSFDDVRRIIGRGHFIWVPLAGRQINNPFFTNGGPKYHAFVIKGFEIAADGTKKVITHEVGTKNGADYVYKWDVIQKAIHDYAENIDDGAKEFLEVLPPL